MKLLTRTWRIAGFAAVAAGTPLLYACSDTPSPTDAQVTSGAAPLAVPDGFTWDLRYTDAASPQTDVGTPAAIWEFPVAFNVGTGLIDPFLSVQNSPLEYGFNTDASTLPYDDTRPQFTDAIRVSDLPTIVYNSANVKEIIFDANENNKDLLAAQFAINTFNLYVCQGLGDAPATYSTTADLANCGTPVYTFGSGRAAATDAATKGSGQALDYRILFPESLFPGSGDGCAYDPTGQSACTNYVILETQMGDASDTDWETGSTFEEFSVIKRPKVTIDKTANVTFRRTYHWIVKKTADPDVHNLSLGETSPTTTYTITADLAPGEDAYTDDNFVISGVITVTNPSTKDWKTPAQIDNVWDILPDGSTKLEPTCYDSKNNEVTFPYELDYGESITCPYETDPLEGLKAGDENTAYVDYSDPADQTTELPTEEFSKELDFAAEPSDVVNATVNVYDEYQGRDSDQAGAEAPVLLGTASVDDPPPTSFTRERTWTFTEDLTQCGAFDNKASIYYVNGDVQEELPADEATAQVQVNCASYSISGHKWNDLNADGTWDASEPGLNGWEIQLWQGTTMLAGTTTADDGGGDPGYYEFSGLAPGDYEIREVCVAGWDQSYPTPTDGCGSGVHDVTLAAANVEDQDFGNYQTSVPPMEETAYALGDGATNDGTTTSTCFIPTFSNWGWTNGELEPGTTQTWEVWAGAGQCDITKGQLAGHVTITYAANGDFSYEFALEAGFQLVEEHVYAGTTEFPMVDGVATVAPGQYYIEDGLDGSQPIYVIYHAVVSH